ncbi:hypothetical protein PGTUg99_020211 [Puccinia graminis f. sp. tritici]|uniref:cDENN domain-containing protein n=1 Tax=Puccinia graminis f. sp. tritici TaxID=56615 RepID=A0A5B0SN35_PUCGR|nr:hypothetical protein PGTUg99_020211 [Puccinia graminis f. sp. tritici]
MASSNHHHAFKHASSFTSQANTIKSPTTSTLHTSSPSTFDSSPPSSTFSTISSFSSSPFFSPLKQPPTTPSNNPSTDHHHHHNLLENHSNHSHSSSQPRTSPVNLHSSPNKIIQQQQSSSPFLPKQSSNNNTNNNQFHRLALELSLPGTNSALESALKLHDLTQPQQHHHQSIGSIPTSDASTIDPPSSQSPRGAPPLESPRFNSASYYSMPLPNLPSPPLSSYSQLRIQKCPSSTSKNSTAITSRSKKKARGPGSDRNNTSSFDTIPLILPKFSRPSELNLPQSLLDSRPSLAKQPDTLASIYMVCGLPKNPQCWTLAQPDYLPSHLPGAVSRFWRPEVLGTTVSGQEILSAPPAENNLPSNNAPSPEAIGKEELSKIQSKAIKLAFAREVEVIASTVQPPSTTHCFSFTVPAQPAGDQHEISGALGHQWDLGLSCSSDSTSRQPAEKTYYAACLQVWSHTDRLRAEAICKTLEEGSKAKSAAVVQAIKAAAAGRKLGSKLEKAVNSPMGFLPSSAELSGNAIVHQSSGPNRLSAHSGFESTDTEDADGFFSESEWETGTELLSDNIAGRLASSSLNFHDTQNSSIAPNTPLWLPYCLVLISKFPLYDLLVDHLKISWARYHNSIYKHSQEMLKMLNFSLSKSSPIIKLPVGSSKESNTKFIVKLPGKTDLSNGGLEEVNFTMWPLFKCLSIHHIISIYEIGLSPMGRIVFFSSHPAILNIAVESFKLLLELRGWVGLSQSIIHSRDFKIYLEDPGPFILGANSQLRHIAADVSPEIMIVDLDTDTIKCPKPHPDALSKGQDRMKIERKLYNLLGNFTGPKSVPVELQEAFPGGRFRPFSAVEIKDQPSEAERLLPPPEWNWSQTRTIILFDDVMSKMPRKGIGKILKRTTNRQAAVLDSSALHVQEIIRKHTVRFVDRRDMLETKIWKLNRRLAFLMSESMEWKQHFDNFQKFTDMLSIESQDLKTRLENERREHHTLTGVVAEQKCRQVELEGRLLETEKAWMAAQVELAKAQEIREELQRQKEIMVSEMKSIALGGEDQNMVGQIVPRIGSYAGTGPMRRSSISHNRQISLTTKNLRRLSAQDRLSSPCSTSRLEPHEESEFETDCSLGKLGSTGGYHNFLGAESDAETVSDDASGVSEIPDDDERALLSRSAVVETMRSIQTRLEAALRTAGQLDEEELKGYEINSPFAKSAFSRMSTDSQGSKVIPLQRGRRKPNNSVTFESDTTNLSISSSPAPNTHQNNETQFVSADSPTDALMSQNRPSNRPVGSSAVSLLLPGSSIFRGKPNNGLGDSQTSSSSTEKSQESASKQESEEDDDYRNDSRSEDGISCDDGASFVSANDQSDSLDRRRISTDSWSLNPDQQRQSLEQPNSTSRVSIICASPSRPESHAPTPSQTTRKSNARKSLKASEMIAFPTCPSEYDEDEEEGDLRIQRYLDDSREYGSELTGEEHTTTDKTVMDLASAQRAFSAAKQQNGKVINDSLRSPREEPNGIHHRGSFVSNCSSTTVKNVGGQGPLPHSPLVPARTLHRQSRASHTTIKLSNTHHHHPLPPLPPSIPRADLVDFPLDHLRLNVGSIQSSRRLRSVPSPTTPLCPASIRNLKENNAN